MPSEKMGLDAPDGVRLLARSGIPIGSSHEVKTAMVSRRNRKPDYSKAPSESLRRMGRYIPPDQPAPKNHSLNQSFYRTKQPLAACLRRLQSLTFLEILGLVINIWILIAIAAYISTEKQRRDAEVLNAWQTITSADGLGSGGRIQALEFLNASPGAAWRRKFPWFCAPLPLCTWPAESLAGINLVVESTAEPGAENWQYASSDNGYGAYLSGIVLPRAYLGSANLSGAFLRDANLEGAFLWDANLEGAYLFGVNLTGAYLRNANLEGVNLLRANLEGANLDSANLAGANLWDANLEGAYLRRVNLEGANLKGANLEGANLKGANLARANLDSANLAKANLDSVNLEEADLRVSNLAGVKLGKTNLTGALLVSANLARAELRGVNLERADLRLANLQGVYLGRANLEGANLWRANLEGANLWDVNLSGANLRKVNLARADLLGANLAGANLREANLVGAEDLELTEAKLCNTMLPTYITIDPDRDCDELQR